MSQFGSVRHVELMMDKNTGRHRGFAFITFDDTDSVDKAVCKFTCVWLMQTFRHTFYYVSVDINKDATSTHSCMKLFESK